MFMDIFQPRDVKREPSTQHIPSSLESNINALNPETYVNELVHQHPDDRSHLMSNVYDNQTRNTEYYPKVDNSKRNKGFYNNGHSTDHNTVYEKHNNLRNNMSAQMRQGEDIPHRQSMDIRNSSHQIWSSNMNTQTNQVRSGRPGLQHVNNPLQPITPYGNNKAHEHQNSASISPDDVRYGAYKVGRSVERESCFFSIFQYITSIIICVF